MDKESLRLTSVEPIRANTLLKTTKNRKGMLVTLGLALVIGVAPVRAGATDRIKIKKTNPPASKTLSRTGEPVKLSVNVEYELQSADQGTIGIAVQHGRTTVETVEPPALVVVKKGRGKAILEVVLRPTGDDVNGFDVFVSMIAHKTPSGLEGPGPHRLGTSTVDMVTYRIK